MNNLVINEELFKKLLFSDKTIARGFEAIVQKFNPGELYKMHVRDYYRGYIYQDMGKVDKLIERKRLDDLESNSINKTKFLDLNEKVRRLKLTSSNDLIKSALIYNDYPVGVIIKEYEGYENYKNLYKHLSDEQNIYVLDVVKEKISELVKEGLYYTDLHMENIMINKDLDVKLIDLDSETVYMDPRPSYYYIGFMDDKYNLMLDQISDLNAKKQIKTNRLKK